MTSSTVQPSQRATSPSKFQDASFTQDVYLSLRLLCSVSLPWRERLALDVDKVCFCSTSLGSILFGYVSLV